MPLDFSSRFAYYCFEYAIKSCVNLAKYFYSRQGKACKGTDLEKE